MKTEEQVREELAKHEAKREAIRQRLVEIAQQRQRLEAERATLNQDLMICNGMIAMAYETLEEEPQQPAPLPGKQPSRPTAGPPGAKVKRPRKNRQR